MTDQVSIARWVFALALIFAVTARPARRILGKECAFFGLPLFLLLWGYLYWIWGSLFSLPANASGVWISGGAALLALHSAGAFYVRDGSRDDSRWDWSGTALFVLLWIAAAAIRSRTPEMIFAEKYADMAIFQGALLDLRFPAEDRWLSGVPVNYYYFGYLLFAPLVRATAIAPEWGVPLAMITVFSLTGLSAFMICRRCGFDRRIGWAAAFCATFLCNAEWVRQLFVKHTLAGFSWWDSSRAIPGTITEFPYFSFLLGDFHSHFIAVPWIGLSFALIWELRTRARVGELLPLMIVGGLAALSVGTHYSINSWEYPFVVGILLVAMGRLWIPSVGVIAGGALLILPFWLSYQPPISSPGWVPTSLRSSLGYFVLHWGVFLIPILVIALSRLSSLTSRMRWVALLVLLAGAAIGGLSFGVIAGMAFLLIASGAASWENPESLLLLAAGLAIAIPEFIHVDHLYGPELKRMNTVFKFYVMGWWALAIAVPMWISRYRDRLKVPKPAFSGLLAVCVSVGTIYPWFGTRSRMGPKPLGPTLDGMVHWDSNERDAVRWLRSHSEPREVVWEASGPAYQHYGRFASFTGRPTLLGWDNHQWVWRRKGHELADERRKDMDRVNQDPRAETLDPFLRKYRVRWIVVGPLETQSYSEGLKKEISRFEEVFSSPTVRIYEVASSLTRRSAKTTE